MGPRARHRGRTARARRARARAERSPPRSASAPGGQTSLFSTRRRPRARACSSPQTLGSIRGTRWLPPSRFPARRAGPARGSVGGDGGAERRRRPPARPCLGVVGAAREGRGGPRGWPGRDARPGASRRWLRRGPELRRVSFCASSQNFILAPCSSGDLLSALQPERASAPIHGRLLSFRLSGQSHQGSELS